MAAVAINFTFKDAKGKSRITKVHVPTGFSIAQYTQFANSLAQVIANMSEGAITEISIGVPLDISAASIKGVALGIADVAKKAFFGALSSVSGLFAKYIIPTYDESHSVPNSDDIDVSDPDVAAYIAFIESGGTYSGIPVHAEDKYGNDIDEVNIAREQFRKFN